MTRIPLVLSARVVAERLGRPRRWVYRMCESGAFDGAFRDPHWRIPEPAVLAYLDLRQCARRLEHVGQIGARTAR